MSSFSHLSDADLLLFENRELSQGAAQNVEVHLQNCSACRNRLQQLRGGISAYREYREDILPPLLPATEWPSLHSQFEAVDGHPARRNWFTRSKLFWAVATAGVCLTVYQHFSKNTNAERMQQLLAQSAALPSSSSQARLLLTANGHRWLRPALLRAGESFPDSNHLQALFVQAHYSWEDPLSARSFARWRKQLPEKQDEVTTIRDESGQKRFYRLQTSTTASFLRHASLTLRADTTRTVNAFFSFAGKEEVQMEEQGPESVIPPARTTPAMPPKTTETLASPEDMLRVFEALNFIGADEDEPVDVNFDASRRHILVTAMGLSPVRQNEVKEVLQGIPHTLVRFDADLPIRATKRPSNRNPDAYSADNTSAFRHRLEEKAGGAQSLQLITDHALEASSHLFTQAHALFMLAQRFPPAMENKLTPSGQVTLRTLRRRHTFALRQTALQLGAAVKPLLEPVSATVGEPTTASSWQKNAGDLFETARNLDTIVSRLLTGNPEETGEGDLRRLPNDLEKAEQLAHTQTVSIH